MKIFKNIKDYHVIKKSNLFDAVWFKNNYGLSGSVNPIIHYLKYGIKEGLNPSKNFDTLWYLNEYGDVKNSGMHPFVHYIRHGIEEHRLSDPLFIKNDDKFSLINQDYNPCFFNKNYETIDENDVNVAFFFKNDVDNFLPTEYIRLIIPFYHLFLEKNFKPYIFRKDCFQEKHFRNVDVVIVQRDALDENNAKFLVKICKINKIPLIYEIDDDLLGIDENHIDYDEIIEKKGAIEYLISNSDIVTVSTKSLKEKLLHLNSNIKVIKNTLNDMLNLENNSSDSDVIKIGYMGTITHKNDVKIIENAIDNVKHYFSRKGKTVIFETVGVSDTNIKCANPVNIPFKYSKYPYFIRWFKKVIDWDIGLAPLENTEINASKSEIKYLEYTSLGIPGIYSNFGAYSEAIQNNFNGILIKNNSSDEWESEIINLIENTELQKDIVKNAITDIAENYSIDIMVNSWLEIFEDLLNKEKLQIFNKDSLKLLVNPIFNDEYNIIAESGLFDVNQYLVVDIDSIYHFLIKGVFEGYDPYNEFNAQAYSKGSDLDIIKINPLVHFIKKFNYKFKYNFLSSDNIDDIIQNMNNKVSIIIPIYNAYEDTKKCIESVFKYSTVNFDLILINDNSTDERISKLLEHYQNSDNVKVITNEINVGFVASVNVGLNNSYHDVILLNSDTIVTPNWIQKLTIAAFSDEKIATVTPFSNDAGVFSVPFSNKKNIIPKNLGINGVSTIVEKVSNHKYLRVPTGNGFCMFIKRKIIRSIGYFDEKTFGRGYCEENDFCMRAIYDGWVNIIDDSTYIFHNESSSFGKEKQYLIEKNMNLLLEKHQTYSVKVNNFVNSNEFKEMKCIIYDALKNNCFNKKRVLYVSNFKNVKNDQNENYLLYINNQLTLYYCDNGLFKIKEWYLEEIDMICFNIIVNFGIDELVIEIPNLNLFKSNKLVCYLNKNS